MDNSAYLDFDEAVSFLRTTPSTLYKWLQAGKVPGHKLGRQWRFLKDELELHVSGKGLQIQSQKEILALAQLLMKRSSKEVDVNSETQGVAEQLIWDAYDHGSRQIHISPIKGRYEVRYRDRKGLENLTEFHEETFCQIDSSWRMASAATKGEDLRRMHLHRGEEDSLQVRYQKIDTVSGAHITLRLWNPKKDVLPLEKISSGDYEVLQTFKSWASKSYGLIVLAGASGSGKTTTFYSMLNEISSKKSVIFTVENPLEMVLEGIGQIELSKKTPDEFAATIERVLLSDPDVLGLGLGHYEGLESTMLKSALHAATTGHLVLLQLNATSSEQAMEILQKYSDRDMDSILVGICHQKLVPGPKGLRAVYKFLKTNK